MARTVRSDYQAQLIKIGRETVETSAVRVPDGEQWVGDPITAQEHLQEPNLEGVALFTGVAVLHKIAA